ncbi:transcriptional regulator, TetR family [Caloranaerobacter azorensis DSM 13643]|uniref:Transcriptional regulator, TetR family n=1 Tax=Caloranaerobacter azorensis DSM 13643 TaxID=1121264 RepID=A0A1M5WEW9_9FIRM|nr:TetR/AcrR family transcriptional regulator [Caloranaerobacter azorensis]SHH86099.1 transcriptional regulator, TetR family [Caloranaerobacter azorensis DSM 13643]
MPKIVDYEKKKKEIVEKAINVFIKKGYYNTNLSEIASQCGMGRTTLYQYFNNKEEIFHYAIKNVVDAIKSDIKKTLEKKDSSFIDKLKEIIEKLVLYHSNTKNMYLLVDFWLILERENSEILERVREHALELRETFKNILNEAIESREIKNIDKDTMSKVLYGLVESLLFHISVEKDYNPRRHLKSINVLIDGLKA